MSHQNSPHRMVPNGTFNFPLPKKFMQCLKNLIFLSIQKHKTEHPEWTVVQALACIIGDSNKKLTPPMVLEYVEDIIAKWASYDFEPIIKPSAFLDSPHKSHFSEKYRQGLKGVAAYSIAEIKKNQPEWTLMEALAHILKDTNPDMPPPFITEFVQHIVTAWETYQMSEKESSELAVA